MEKIIGTFLALSVSFSGLYIMWLADKKNVLHNWRYRTIGWSVINGFLYSLIVLYILVIGRPDTIDHLFYILDSSVAGNFIVMHYLIYLYVSGKINDGDPEGSSSLNQRTRTEA